MKTIDDFAKINFRKALSSSEAFTLQFINPFVYNNFHLAFDKLNDVQKSGSIKLLDVGCGEQPYRSLIEKIGFKYVGMDVAARNVKLDVVAPIDDKNLLCDNRRGNIYDVIVLTEVLEHVEKYQKLTDEIHRVLKKGGRGIITIPWSARYHYIPWDYFRYTPSSLKKIFSKFSTVEIKPRGTDIAVIGSKIIVLFFRNLLPKEWWRWLLVPLWIAISPVLLIAVIISHIALALKLGSSEDPLGYTILVTK